MRPVRDTENQRHETQMAQDVGVGIVPGNQFRDSRLASLKKMKKMKARDWMEICLTQFKNSNAQAQLTTLRCKFKFFGIDDDACYRGKDKRDRADKKHAAARGAGSCGNTHYHEKAHSRNERFIH